MHVQCTRTGNVTPLLASWLAKDRKCGLTQVTRDPQIRGVTSYPRSQEE